MRKLGVTILGIQNARGHEGQQVKPLTRPGGEITRKGLSRMMELGERTRQGHSGKTRF